jgi:predicted small lipoprotein YifL
MRRPLLITAAVALLAGCGPERPLTFASDSIPAEQQARDFRECRFEGVRTSAGRTPYDWASATWERRDIEARVFNACMESRGYKPGR